MVNEEEPPAELALFAKACAEAYEVMWAKFGEHYPEVATGDFGPGETVTFELEVLTMLRLWLFYNHPDRDFADNLLWWNLTYVDIGWAEKPSIDERAWKPSTR